MKKLLYLFSTALLAFASCTNDYDSSCFKKDDVNPPKTDSIPAPHTDSIPVIVGPILLKQLVHTYSGGEETKILLSYIDNKIVSDTEKFNTTLYTYTGDLITKIEKADTSGNIYSTKEYFYTNGRLDYILSKDYETYSKIRYTYNNDGTIHYYKLNSDSAGNDGDYTPIHGEYTFSEGNLIQTKQYNGSIEIFTTYEYDSKNNPRLNILGFDKLIDMPQLFAINNVIKKVGTTTSSSAAPVTSTTTYTHEYDANGYPVKTIQTTYNGDIITTESSQFSY